MPEFPERDTGVLQRTRPPDSFPDGHLTAGYLGVPEPAVVCGRAYRSSDASGIVRRI